MLSVACHDWKSWEKCTPRTLELARSSRNVREDWTPRNFAKSQTGKRSHTVQACSSSTLFFEAAKFVTPQSKAMEHSIQKRLSRYDVCVWKELDRRVMSSSVFASFCFAIFAPVAFLLCVSLCFATGTNLVCSSPLELSVYGGGNTLSPSKVDNVYSYAPPNPFPTEAHLIMIQTSERTSMQIVRLLCTGLRPGINSTACVVSDVYHM